MDSNGIVTEDDFLVNSCSNAVAITSASIRVSQLYVGKLLIGRKTKQLR